jgi:HD-like signal output (HDOD) protein
MNALSRPSAQAPVRRPIYELIADPRAHENLPSLSSVIQELEDMASQQHVMIQEIARLIRSDQSLAVRLLRLANSAYFAPSQPIIDVDHALIYLGLSQVRSCMLTARCIEKTCNISPDLMPWKEFWRHAVAVGCITKLLAARLNEPTMGAESYYVVGLFHDIGKLVLAYLSPDDFTEVVTTAMEKKCLTSIVEVELLGLDHSTLGAWYLQHQGMPPTIFEPVRLHHAWSVDASGSPLAALINLADQLAHSLAIGRSGSFVTGDPYKSEEWEKYVSCCGELPPGLGSTDHADLTRMEMEKVPDLVYSIVL